MFTNPKDSQGVSESVKVAADMRRGAHYEHMLRRGSLAV